MPRNVRLAARPALSRNNALIQRSCITHYVRPLSTIKDHYSNVKEPQSKSVSINMRKIINTKSENVKVSIAWKPAATAYSIPLRDRITTFTIEIITVERLFMITATMNCDSLQNYKDPPTTKESLEGIINIIRTPKKLTTMFTISSLFRDSLSIIKAKVRVRNGQRFYMVCDRPIGSILTE